MPTTEELAGREWDFVVVGTGMGGATLGHALARAGRQVLFLERGRSSLDTASALRGDYAETFMDSPDLDEPAARQVLARAGRAAEALGEIRHGHQMHHTVPFIGHGTGGSSALYGMALERFHPSDFESGHYYRDAADTTLPVRWPIAYADLEDYYRAAEQLYRVRGTADTMRGAVDNDFLPPKPFCAPNQELHDFLQARGMHPYHLPMACEFVAGCPGCQGYLCSQACKNDSTRICLQPALADYKAVLADDCEVLRLNANQHRITGVVCRTQGREVEVRAKTCVLAAGALATPAILLRSASDEWPQGIANTSDMVGRNLMRHFLDLYAVFTRNRAAPGSNNKQLAFNDLYLQDGEKYGSVQSFGSLPPSPVMVAEIAQEQRAGMKSLQARAFRLIAPALNRLLSRTTILAATLEDLPYTDNRLVVTGSADRDTGGVALDYRVHSYDAAKIRAFRKQVRALLKPYRVMLIKQAHNNGRLAHACGTCRFGTDPRDSVLDPYNRAHGVENLYVVDSSFFPSSAAINPALTIAANALRVAAHITDRK